MDLITPNDYDYFYSGQYLKVKGKRVFSWLNGEWVLSLITKEEILHGRGL